MNRKEHLKKYLYAPLPDPETPADDAWAGMSDMLDVAGSQEATGTGRLCRGWKSMGKLKGLLIGASAIVTSVIALIVLNTGTINQKAAVNQSVHTNIQEPAARNTAVGRSAIRDSVSVKPDPDKFDLHTDSASFSTKITATTPAKTTNTSGNVAPGNERISESGHVKAENEHTETVVTHSDRMLTGVARAERARNIYTRPRARGRSTLSGSGSRQSNAASTKNLSVTNHAAQEAISPVSLEKNSNAASSLDHSIRVQMQLNNLKPLPGRFGSMVNDLGKLVKKPELPNVPQPVPASRKPVISNLHFGTEWSLYQPFYDTEYLLTAADSIKRPARLAIPGVFISKNWNRHAATFVFTPSHSYFGNYDRVAQVTDSIKTPDSTFINLQANTNFIKATGLNFTLHYQYGANRWLSVSAGASYARFFRALFQKETVSSSNPPVPGNLVRAKGLEAMKGFIHPQQWTLRAGIIIHPPFAFNGRAQTGLNLLLPVSNLSQHNATRIRSLNAQIFLRFLIR